MQVMQRLWRMCERFGELLPWVWKKWRDSQLERPEAGERPEGGEGVIICGRLMSMTQNFLI